MSDAFTDAARQTERALEKYRKGFTIADEKDPRIRIEKLRERQGHLRDEIAIKEDQISIMEHEIAELNRR